jgi:hypothetical protein
MTTTIYINPFVFEKHGPYFSEYIALCIKHHKDEKGENTENHHIFPRHKGGTMHRWNMVHLEYELHIEAHRLLMEAFPEDIDLEESYHWTKRRGSSRGEASSMLGKTGELHPMYGKTGESHPRFGKAPWNKGAKTGKRLRIKCEYCGGDFAANNYERWHGEKCKLKT